MNLSVFDGFYIVEERRNEVASKASSTTAIFYKWIKSGSETVHISTVAKQQGSCKVLFPVVPEKILI